MARDLRDLRFIMLLRILHHACLLPKNCSRKTPAKESNPKKTHVSVIIAREDRLTVSIREGAFDVSTTAYGAMMYDCSLAHPVSTFYA